MSVSDEIKRLVKDQAFVELELKLKGAVQQSVAG
jgi:hypothetical protein